MSIIVGEASEHEQLQLVTTVEICTLSDEQKSVLQLNYQSQSYALVQAFGSHQRERAEQKLHQLSTDDRAMTDAHSASPREKLRERQRYLLVQEVGYYSLWELAVSLNPPNLSGQSRCNAPVEQLSQHEIDLEVQQASIWLFQELWLQWQDLLGAGQLQVFADSLLAVNPQLGSWIDLDRLLNLDPLALDKLASWSELDFIRFDRQLYQLTQKKLGQQFGTKLTIEIIQAMPDLLRVRSIEILGV